MLATDTRPSAIAIMGPTASGKTDIAIALAQRFNGEVISVDSALVYRGMDIGTAKPDASLRAAIVHHMLDLCFPWESYSAAKFAIDARKCITEVISRDRLPILVGGTGLYFRALFEGLAPLPSADLETRARIVDEAKQHGWRAMHAKLSAIDELAGARIRANDIQRIQRALEVFYITGMPITYWYTQQRSRRIPLRILKCAIAPKERTQLHARIKTRFDAMLAMGFLDEIHRLRSQFSKLSLSQPSNLPAMRAVGYRQGWDFLEGKIDQATFYAQSIKATCELAKRQLTWFRAQRDARWFDPIQDARALCTAVQHFV